MRPFIPPGQRHNQNSSRRFGRACQSERRTANDGSARREPQRSAARMRSGIAKDLRRRVAAVIAEEEHDHVLVGQVVFEPNLPLVGLKARLVYSKLSNLGNIRYLDPPLADIENRETLDALCFGIVTERPPEAVQHYLQVAGVQQIIVEPFERRPLAGKRPLRPAAPTPPSWAPNRPKPCAWISNVWTGS